ncbi:MAG: hypothetical protein Q8O03_09525 [Nanoarchaeota archaeon]|nr:hypothetical protein [Nanoarchaeota archaeon]
MELSDFLSLIMVIKEIFYFVGSSLGILWMAMKIYEKLHNLRKNYSKKPEIKITSWDYSSGCSMRTKEEKEDLKGYSEKLPDVVPHFSFGLRLINTSEKDNVVDLYFYTRKNNGKRLNLGGEQNIVLKPMKPTEIKFKDIIFNLANETSFWENIGWEKLKNNEEIMSLFWRIKLDALYIDIEDAYNKKTTLRLPLAY